MRPLLAHPCLNVYLHEGPTPVLELQWLSYVSSTDYRAVVSQALDFTRTHHVKAWLADDRLLGAVRPRDLDWAEEFVLRPLDQAGLLRLALLESADVLNRLTIKGMYARVESHLRFPIRRFEDLAAARAWASKG